MAEEVAWVEWGWVFSWPLQPPRVGVGEKALNQAEEVATLRYPNREAVLRSNLELAGLELRLGLLLCLLLLSGLDKQIRSLQSNLNK